MSTALARILPQPVQRTAKRYPLALAGVAVLTAGVLLTAARGFFGGYRAPYPLSARPGAVRGFDAALLVGSGSHGAIDIGFPTGTPIYAAAAGTVRKVRYDHPTAGTYIEIEHSNGHVSRYLHLSDPTPSTPVAEGSYVTRGQQIGLSGGQPGTYGAGNTTAPHLHFELWEGTPFSSQRLDPADYIQFAAPDGIDWAWWGSLLTPGLYLTGGTLLAVAIGRRIGKRRR